MGLTQISRIELYNQAWTEAMSSLARRLGISGVGLAKVCRKHSIPCPPRGYWAKKAAGQQVRQTPLPNRDQNPQITFGNRTGPHDQSTSDQDQTMPHSAEIAKAYVVELRDHLRGAHPLVTAANHEMQFARFDSDGLVVLSEHPTLRVQVTKPQIRRALFIVDSLLRAFESQGDQVGRGPTVTLLGMDLRFSVSEKIRVIREEHEDTTLDGGYDFFFNRYQLKRVPSGQLTLEIECPGKYWIRNCRHTWRDTPKHTLEQRLASVIKGFVEFAAHARGEAEERRLEAEARAAAEALRQEQARQLQLKQAKVEAERKRCQDLLNDANRWRQSDNLRQYVEAARKKHESVYGAIEAGSKMYEWIEWALSHADWLDPLTESPASLLDDPD
jgi:hypothetical protein